MHFENVKKLMEMTAEPVKKGHFFKYNLQTKTIEGIQTAVIRTNCMDCLDRIMNDEYGLFVGTNVVQSEYAKEILFTALFEEKGKEIMNECLYVQ